MPTTPLDHRSSPFRLGHHRRQAHGHPDLGRIAPALEAPRAQDRHDLAQPRPTAMIVRQGVASREAARLAVAVIRDGGLAVAHRITRHRGPRRVVGARRRRVARLRADLEPSAIVHVALLRGALSVGRADIVDRAGARRAGGRVDLGRSGGSPATTTRNLGENECESSHGHRVDRIETLAVSDTCLRV